MEGILIVDFSPSHNKDLYYCTYLGLASRGPIFRKRNRTFRRSRTGEGPGVQPQHLVRQEARLS